MLRVNELDSTARLIYSRLTLDVAAYLCRFLHRYAMYEYAKKRGRARALPLTALAVVNANADDAVPPDAARVIACGPPRVLVVALKVVEDLVGDGADLLPVQGGGDVPILELSQALGLIVNGGNIGASGQLHEKAVDCGVICKSVLAAGHNEKIKTVHEWYLL